MTLFSLLSSAVHVYCFGGCLKATQLLLGICLKMANPQSLPESESFLSLSRFSQRWARDLCSANHTLFSVTRLYIRTTNLTAFVAPRLDTTISGVSWLSHIAYALPIHRLVLQPLGDTGLQQPPSKFLFVKLVSQYPWLATKHLNQYRESVIFLLSLKWLDWRVYKFNFHFKFFITHT